MVDIDYTYFDSKAPSVHRRRCINGQITGSGNCVGYCMFREHPGFLTNRLRQQHKCIANGCIYYLEKQKRIKQKNTTNEELSVTIMNQAIKLLSNCEGIKILKSKLHDNCCILQYITITNAWDLEKYEKELYDQFHLRVRFEKLNYGFDKCISIIFS